MTRVSTSEEGRPVGLGASSFNRVAWTGARVGYEPCFVRMGQGYGEPSPWSTMQPDAGRARAHLAGVAASSPCSSPPKEEMGKAEVGISRAAATGNRSQTSLNAETQRIVGKRREKEPSATLRVSALNLRSPAESS